MSFDDFLSNADVDKERDAHYAETPCHGKLTKGFDKI
jgi:hypothetical protein